MSARVRFSVKGQVVIPKDVRDRYQFGTGDVADLVETPEGVLIKRPVRAKIASFDEALSSLHASIDYNGPKLNEADWKAAIKRAMQRAAG